MQGRVLAAVCVAGPLDRVPVSAGLMWGPAVRSSAEETEAALAG
ncbi:hypothetical protein [Rhodococcoides yunnanense]|nr:hypothetical protein [Rhodococcus yunnanensis]